MAAESHSTETKITVDTFDTITLPNNETCTIYKYTMTNGFLTVEVINYGSTITSIKMPDKDGKISDLVLGFDNIEGYSGPGNAYFGATVGRVANRISNGKFQIGDTVYNISKNVGPHTLHGGIKGFDKKIWTSDIENGTVVMNYLSEDLEEGFPGNLSVEARYTLTRDNEIVITYKATTDKTTAVNIVNHSYFNLAGVETGAEGLYEHDIVIYANKYTPTTQDYSIPTGEIADVQGTQFDLHKMANLGQKISATTNKDGFDINYGVDGSGFRKVSFAIHPSSKRYLCVLSDQPGVQFYTTNFLQNVTGKNNITYGKHSAFCLETQNYPDAVNNPNFPSPFLEPGSLYEHTLCFKFGLMHPTD